MTGFITNIKMFIIKMCNAIITKLSGSDTLASSSQTVNRDERVCVYASLITSKGTPLGSADIKGFLLDEMYDELLPLCEYYLEEHEDGSVTHHAKLEVCRH